MILECIIDYLLVSFRLLVVFDALKAPINLFTRELSEAILKILGMVEISVRKS